MHFGESVSMRHQSSPQIDLNISIGTILPPQADSPSLRHDSCSPTQEIPYKLPLIPILSYLYPIQSLAIYYQGIYLHIILLSVSISPKSSLPFRSSDNFPLLPHTLHILPIRHFDLFTVRIMTKSKTGQHSSK